MMRNIKTFGMFSEALLPSQFRRYAKAFDKERYSDIFAQYPGDRNKYRIYLPLKGDAEFLTDDPEEESTEQAIVSLLKKAGYEVLDYVKGTCKHMDAKNPSKIGQVLTKLGATDYNAKRLMKDFVEDENRKAGSKEDLMVIISRHPYDIAGADTDRDWTNCMTMAHAGSERVQKKQAELEKIRKEMTKVKQDWQTAEQELDELKHARMADKESRPRKEDIDAAEERERELKHRFTNLEEREENLKQEIEERTETGANAKYLLYDVKEGSLIAYLVRKDDKNINKPVSVLNIKPYIRSTWKDDEETLDYDDFVLVSDNNMYGKKVPAFKDTVDDWLDGINKAKYGDFKLKPMLYSDSQPNVVKRYAPGELTDVFKTPKKLAQYLEDQVYDADAQIEILLGMMTSLSKDPGYKQFLSVAGKLLTTRTADPGIRAAFAEEIAEEERKPGFDDLYKAALAAEKDSATRGCMKLLNLYAKEPGDDIYADFFADPDILALFGKGKAKVRTAICENAEDEKGDWESVRAFISRHFDPFESGTYLIIDLGYPGNIKGITDAIYGYGIRVYGEIEGEGFYIDNETIIFKITDKEASTLKLAGYKTVDPSVQYDDDFRYDNAYTIKAPKKEKKEKDKKNESRISRFGNFRRM